MIDPNAIQQGVQVVKNEHGVSVVQVPLELWEAILKQLQAEMPQHLRFQAFLKEWENYADEDSDAWWDDFQAFLKANRLNFPERDLKLGDNE